MMNESMKPSIECRVKTNPGFASHAQKATEQCKWRRVESLAHGDVSTSVLYIVYLLCMNCDIIIIKVLSLSLIYDFAGDE